MGNWMKVAVVALVAGGLSACSAREAQNGVESGEASVTVQVENQSFSDMTIYVYEGVQRVRLGSVPGVSSRTFRIPERLLFGISALRFQADPLGGGASPITSEIALLRQARSLRAVASSILAGRSRMPCMAAISPHRR